MQYFEEEKNRKGQKFVSSLLGYNWNRPPRILTLKIRQLVNGIECCCAALQVSVQPTMHKQLDSHGGYKSVTLKQLLELKVTCKVFVK